MADKLLFVGDKHVKNQEGNELELLRPTRGGDTHQVVRWWNRHPQQVVYVKSAIFYVNTASRGRLALVIPLGGAETIKLTIIHDGNGVFTFPDGHIGVERVAVFSDTLVTMYEEYQFSKISGGATLRRTIIPLPAAETTITGISITGELSPEVGTTEDYVAAVTAGDDPGPYEYAWTATRGTITAGAGTATVTVDWAAGAGSLQCVLGSTSATFDGNSVTDSIAVNTTVPVPPSGPADSITLVGAVTTEAAGSIANAATTSPEGNGSGLTVSYDSDGSAASNLTIGDSAGTGYQNGDTFTVDGDTGVTGTIAIAALLTTYNAQADVSHVVTAAGGYFYIDGVQQAEVSRVEDP